MKTQCTALLLILAPSAAMAADQFDLKCEGERQFGLQEPAVPHGYGFRIDLKAQKWCWERCDIIYDIEAIQPDRLVLKREDVKTPANSRYFLNEISRTTGQHDLESIITRPIAAYFKIKGKCEPAPFSGFPATKF